MEVSTLEKSPEIVSTLDTAVGERMHNINVQVTGEQATETVSCDNRVECSLKQNRTKKSSRQPNYYYRKK